jgi:hypothetical protein
MPERTIIIGDVHGCYQELVQLIDKINYQPKTDRLIFIGDLINKGPESKKVFDLFRELDAEAILGNHEWYIIEQDAARKPKWGGYFRMKEEFGKDFDAFVEEIDTWPLYIKEPDFVAVHAGRVPFQRYRDSTPRQLTTIRTWGPDNTPWYEFYTGRRLVVFGHWAAQGGIVRDNVIGLDTGCVYGGALSAVILPERKIVQVKASEQYCAITV